MTDLQDKMNAAIDKALGGNLARARVKLRFVTPYVGGQPATDEGVKAYVQHHLGLDPDGKEFEKAVARITGEEVRTDTPEDELEEKRVYGLNIIRRTENGIGYVGTWQIRACLKQSASRLGLFSARGKVGSKGDMSEGMLVTPIGMSGGAGIQQVLICVDGEPYTARIHEKFMGSVGTPQGRKSIVTESEIAPDGAMIEFEIEWPTKKLSPDDMLAILGFAQRVGLGSNKSFERGRFEVIEVQFAESGKKAKHKSKQDAAA